jgi:hypothetical protein
MIHMHVRQQANDTHVRKQANEVAQSVSFERAHLLSIEAEIKTPTFVGTAVESEERSLCVSQARVVFTTSSKVTVTAQLHLLATNWYAWRRRIHIHALLTHDKAKGHAHGYRIASAAGRPPVSLLRHSGVVRGGRRRRRAWATSRLRPEGHCWIEWRIRSPSPRRARVGTGLPFNQIEEY